jgi:hypothetical protein
MCSVEPCLEELYVVECIGVQIHIAILTVLRIYIYMIHLMMEM